MPAPSAPIAVGGQPVSSLAPTSDDFLALVFNPLLGALGVEDVSAVVSNNEVTAQPMTD